MPIGAQDIAVGPRDHVVHLYERDADLVANVGAHLGEALRACETAVVVATEAHRLAFDGVLAGAGLDPADARRRGRLVALDAAGTLARVLVADRPDPARFDAVIGGLVGRAAQHGRPVRAYGEMVALLWDAGNVGAAMELEACWNDLGERLEFSLYCGYRVTPGAGTEVGAEVAEALRQVCQLHTAVVGTAREESAPFRRSLDAPADARRFVRGALDRCGAGDVAEAVTLLVSELATNAVVHAGSDFTVAVSARPDAVRVEVGDASPVAPARREPGTAAFGGRGLLLVDAIASAWGTEPLGDGKVVWAELRR